jgi:spermidine synthase
MRNEKRLIIWSVIGTGITSITVQLITVREFITQFHGSEITISLVLFSWLLLTGAGSLIAKYVKSKSIVFYSLITLLIALWPLPQILLIRHLRETFLIHGVSPGFYQIFFYITLITTPYCLLVGFILPCALNVLRANRHRFSSGELYMTDNIGDISGGIIFSFFLVYWLKPFKTIAVTSSLLILIVLLILLYRKRYYLLVLSILLTAVFYTYALNSVFELSTLNKQYGHIIQYLESPFGRIVITKEEDQHTFWESGLPLYSDSDIIESEEKVHYPMSQLNGNINNVLLVSGGMGETLNEINKYDPGHIDYVELDPYLTRIAGKMGFIKKLPNLRVINDDARAFIKNNDRQYDAVIIDLPDPDTFQINRFFTSEFFALAQKVLTKRGILSFGMEYSPNFISEIREQKLSTVYNTANQYFETVKIIPGEKAYFLCSNGEISTDIPDRLKNRSVSTEYIEGFYYGNVTDERIRYIQDTIDPEEFINTDFEPRMMNIGFKEWFLKYGSSPRAFLLITLMVIAVYLITIKKEEYVLFSSGIAVMGIETLIIYTFQIIYGYVYLKIGAIITVFLFGLLPGAAVGSMYGEKRETELVISEVIMICLLMLYNIWVTFIRTELHQSFFLIYGFLFSFLCGFQFPIAARIIGEKTSPAAGCIAADLAGAAVGTFVVGTLLVPLYGIQSAIIFIIMVKISSSMIILFKRRKRY